MAFRTLIAFVAFSAAAGYGQVALRPDARQAAEILGIGPAILELERANQAPASTDITLRRLLLRQRILEAVVDTNLDVGSVIAGIQQEEAEVQETLNTLTSRRDRSVNLFNLASILVGSGIGVIGNALQFSDSAAKAGDAVSVGAGGASTILSLIGIRVQQNSRFQVDITAPNMLAPIFGRPSQPPDLYPREVWAFLNAPNISDVPPASAAPQVSRLQLLVEEWTKDGRISAENTPAAQRKIAFLTSSFARQRRLSIDDLADRAAMLADLRARISLMSRAMSELMHFLRACEM